MPTVSRLTLPARLASQIRADARRAYPQECCGLLVGEGEAVVRVSRVIPAANMAEDPRRRFEIDPQVQFDLLRALRAGPERLVGHYHSHPDGDAVPSDRDRAMAHDPDAVWIVIAVTGQAAGEMRAYICPHAEFCEIAVVEV